MPSIKLIWHDHNGGIVPKRKGKRYIQLFSVFFNGVISVNQELKNWALKKLFCKNVTFVSNYSIPEKHYKKETFLEGSEGKRILCLANLRIQKNHFLLLKVAKRLQVSHPDWSFHFVGKDFEDDYSDKIKNEITQNNLKSSVCLYGSKTDTDFIISQADIAVFSSNTEGLPVSLLEYGLHRKPVIATKVGEIPLIIIHNQNGFLVDAEDEISYYEYLIKLIDNQELRINFGNSLYETILKNHSENGVLNAYLDWIQTL
jgi:glycosyltransferase involved in cell wall biosynthesis